MITVNSARTMCLEDYGIEEGNSADFVVLDADTPFDAVRLTCECSMWSAAERSSARRARAPRAPVRRADRNHRFQALTAGYGGEP